FQQDATSWSGQRAHREEVSARRGARVGARSGGGELGGAAVVELGGSGPAGEQRPAGLEVTARGEVAEEHGLEAQAVQQGRDPVRGAGVVRGDGESPTCRVALLAAV